MDVIVAQNCLWLTSFQCSSLTVILISFEKSNLAGIINTHNLFKKGNVLWRGDFHKQKFFQITFTGFDCLLTNFSSSQRFMFASAYVLYVLLCIYVHCFWSKDTIHQYGENIIFTYEDMVSKELIILIFQNQVWTVQLVLY